MKEKYHPLEHFPPCCDLPLCKAPVPFMRDWCNVFVRFQISRVSRAHEPSTSCELLNKPTSLHLLEVTLTKLVIVEGGGGRKVVVGE